MSFSSSKILADHILGHSIFLRLAEVKDAEFIYSLRMNSALNSFLSSVQGEVSAQALWLENYKHREIENKEYYFIINKIDNSQPIGTVRMYDFIESKKSFSWGSWILNADKTKSAAIESMLLVYQLAFDHLGFENCHFEVMKNNEKVIAFHQKYGAQITSDDADYFYFNFSKQDFQSTRIKYEKFILKNNHQN